ncbi:MAG: hypothetical protein NT062_18385 [Proteobacteria bacterium]|nr:hypothetical protein [Pseudomonadota bacterium]
MPAIKSASRVSRRVIGQGGVEVLAQVSSEVVRRGAHESRVVVKLDLVVRLEPVQGFRRANAIVEAAGPGGGEGLLGMHHRERSGELDGGRLDVEGQEMLA